MYALSTRNGKFNTPCEIATGKWSFVYEKITNCAALSIFLLTMSRLSQVQCKIAISMLVNGTSINVLAQYFCVHWNTISRLQACFHHSVTVCERQRSGQSRVTTPAEYGHIHPPRPKKSFPALALRNVPSKRRITGQTDWLPQACSKACPNTSSQAS